MQEGGDLITKKISYDEGRTLKKGLIPRRNDSPVHSSGRKGLLRKGKKFSKERRGFSGRAHNGSERTDEERPRKAACARELFLRNSKIITKGTNELRH